MQDQAHGVMPFDTISPSDIERIEILPGGGAVMYGNGTKGGVINIITKKRYDSFSPSIGISYSGLPGFTSSPGYSGDYKIFGSEANVDARFGGKILNNLYYTISGRYLYKYGYRVGDESNRGNISGNLTWDINDKQSLSFDASCFSGLINSSPNLLFIIGSGNDVNNAPSVSKRYNQGEGTTNTFQNRIDSVLTYDYKITDNDSFQAKAFYHYYKNKYVDYVGGYYYEYNGRGSWYDSFSQTGSYFEDQRAGIQLKYEHKTDKNNIIVGLDSIWNYNDNTQIMDINGTYYHPIIAQGHKWSNALYAIDKYNFTDRFSLTSGARYEYAYYYLENYQTIIISGYQLPNYPKKEDLDTYRHNYALEITPKIQISNNASIYAKYERGILIPVQVP